MISEMPRHLRRGRFIAPTADLSAMARNPVGADSSCPPPIYRLIRPITTYPGYVLKTHDRLIRPTTTYPGYVLKTHDRLIGPTTTYPGYFLKTHYWPGEFFQPNDSRSVGTAPRACPCRDFIIGGLLLIHFGCQNSSGVPIRLPFKS